MKICVIGVAIVCALCVGCATPQTLSRRLEQAKTPDDEASAITAAARSHHLRYVWYIDKQGKRVDWGQSGGEYEAVELVWKDGTTCYHRLLYPPSAVIFERD